MSYTHWSFNLREVFFHFSIPFFKYFYFLSYLTLCNVNSHQSLYLDLLVNYPFLFKFTHFFKLYFMKLKILYICQITSCKDYTNLQSQQPCTGVPQYSYTCGIWGLRRVIVFPKVTQYSSECSVWVLPSSVLNRITQASFPFTIAPGNCSSSLRNGRREEVKKMRWEIERKELNSSDKSVKNIKMISRIFPGISSHFDSLMLIMIQPFIVTLGHCLILCVFQNILTKYQWL